MTADSTKSSYTVGGLSLTPGQEETLATILFGMALRRLSD